jgi:DNA primase
LSSDLVIVEGPLDVIGLYQHGIPALAILGKELNKEQLGLLCMKPADASITVLMDPEEPEAPYNVARELTSRFSNIFIGHLPDEVDPGDATRVQAWAAWDDAGRYTGERTSGLRAKLKKLNDSDRV